MKSALPAPKTNPERWVDDHGDALYRYALMRVREASVAQDLVQEAFVAALRSRSTFGGRSSERTWLIGILKHKIGDHLKRLQRERRIVETEGSPADDEGVFDEHGHWRVSEGLGPREWGRDAARALEQKDFWRVLDACLCRLAPRAAEVFVLREIDGLPTSEICKVAGITATHLWVIMHRARTRLRGCLEREWFGLEPGRRSSEGASP